MASGTKLRCPVQAVHHRERMTLRMIHDFFVGHLTGDAIALLVDHHGRDSHYESAIALRRFQFGDGVASGAGHSIFIKRPVYLGILCQRPRQNANWIVAAIAVPGEFDAPGPRQNIHAGPIKRRSERV